MCSASEQQAVFSDAFRLDFCAARTPSTSPTHTFREIYGKMTSNLNTLHFLEVQPTARRQQKRKCPIDVVGDNRHHLQPTQMACMATAKYRKISYGRNVITFSFDTADLLSFFIENRHFALRIGIFRLALALLLVPVSVICVWGGARRLERKQTNEFHTFHL